MLLQRPQATPYVNSNETRGEKYVESVEHFRSCLMFFVCEFWMLPGASRLGAAARGASARGVLLVYFDCFFITVLIHVFLSPLNKY